MKIKSCDLDTLPPKPLKECIDSILPTITNIVNTSCQDGIFVSRWKTSIIRPLLKKSNWDLIPSNYCPVSNLSFLSKPLEKCAMDHVNEHCNLHILLPDYQLAYQNSYLCETAIIRLVNNIHWAMENQHVTAVTYQQPSMQLTTRSYQMYLNTSWARRYST